MVELPCASALVRINLAPMSADLKNVLSLRDHKHLPKKVLRKLKILIPRPIYAEGKYNNEMNKVSDNDKKLFIYRASRAEIPILDMMNIVLNLMGINKEMVSHFKLT